MAAFQTGLGNAFNITLGDRAYDLTINSVAGFVQDAISIGSNLKLDLGLRYDFIGAPTEASNKLVVFDAATNSLEQVGSGIDQIHKSTPDLQPPVGDIWNPTGSSNLAVRAAYAVMDNLQNTGVVTGATSNPPLATPLNVAGAVRLDSAVTTATASGLAPASTDPGYQQGRMQTWNDNVEREFGPVGLMVGYFGSYGDRLSVRSTSTSSSTACGRTSGCRRRARSSRTRCSETSPSAKASATRNTRRCGSRRTIG